MESNKNNNDYLDKLRLSDEKYFNILHLIGKMQIRNEYLYRQLNAVKTRLRDLERFVFNIDNKLL